MPAAYRRRRRRSILRQAHVANDRAGAAESTVGQPRPQRRPTARMDESASWNEACTAGPRMVRILALGALIALSCGQSDPNALPGCEEGKCDSPDSPDLGDPPPNDLALPTCGVDGLKRCGDATGWQFCLSGFVFDPSTFLCRACGKDMQPRCADGQGGASCNVGFVFDANAFLCRACGKDMQPRCAGADGPRCDEGFMFDPKTFVCRGSS
jgi:hypothetical protein